jgi:hypothetical protein
MQIYDVSQVFLYDLKIQTFCGSRFFSCGQKSSFLNKCVPINLKIGEDFDVSTLKRKKAQSL